MASEALQVRIGYEVAAEDLLDHKFKVVVLGANGWTKATASDLTGTGGRKLVGVLQAGARMGEGATVAIQGQTPLLFTAASPVKAASFGIDDASQGAAYAASTALANGANFLGVVVEPITAPGLASVFLER